jgi:hypothetical protein
MDSPIRFEFKGNARDHQNDFLRSGGKAPIGGAEDVPERAAAPRCRHDA